MAQAEASLVEKERALNEVQAKREQLWGEREALIAASFSPKLLSGDRMLVLPTRCGCLPRASSPVQQGSKIARRAPTRRH